jgi:ABC-type uncharacterized transport system permease subunit
MKSSTILLYAIPVALYLAALVLARRGMNAGLGTNGAFANSDRFSQWLLGFAVLIHAAALVSPMIHGAQWHFGFAHAVSIMLCGAAAMLWIEGLRIKIMPLWLLILPLAAMASALPAIFQGSSLGAAAHRPLFIPHLIVGMLAYSFLALAALHAMLMIFAERSLHRPGHGKVQALERAQSLNWLDRLPPLLVLEKILFRVLFAGFVSLTLTLLTGLVFSEEVFGKPWRLDHKNVFSVIAWTVFAVLLVGRSISGWRGRLAARLTLGGFVLLLLAYVGSRFVLEVMLGRG